MSSNIFTHIPEDISEEIFETLVDGDNLRIERIISTGQSTPSGQWYDQEDHEWVILLKGAARLRFEGQDDLRDLSPGDYVNIPAHCRHRVEWTSSEEETIWLAIHYR